MKKIALCMLMLVTSPSFAWVAGGPVTITEVMLWQDTESGNPLYFQTSAGFWCYIPSSEKTLTALIFALYSTGKPAEIYCYDAEEAVMGGVAGAHKLHRIRAQQ